jgi:hypothetical protein
MMNVDKFAIKTRSDIRLLRITLRGDWDVATV